MLTFYLTLADSPEEKSKLECLYILYKKRMWYTANQILNDAFDAEDAVHNAFVGIAKNIDHIKDPKSSDAFAYVITATKHAALNIIKRNHNIAEFDEHKSNIKTNENDFLALLENKILVLSALKKLPDDYRDLLYYLYYMDMSEKDISTLVNRKYPTVRKQISRAKQLLADLIAKEDSLYEK